MQHKARTDQEFHSVPRTASDRFTRVRAAERVRNYPAYGVKGGRKGKRGRKAKGGWVEACCVIDSGNALVLHAVEGGQGEETNHFASTGS